MYCRYIAAATYAAGMAFQTAIEIARSSDPTPVARGLATVRGSYFIFIISSPNTLI